MVRINLLDPKSATMAQVLDAVVAKMDNDSTFTIERACKILNRISRERKLLMRYTPGYINAHIRYRAQKHLVRAKRSTAITTVA